MKSVPYRIGLSINECLSHIANRHFTQQVLLEEIHLQIQVLRFTPQTIVLMGG